MAIQQYQPASSNYAGILATGYMDALLKDVLAPGIKSLVTLHTEAYKMFKEKGTPNDWDLAGRRLVMTLETALNGSYGGVAENATLPTPSRSAHRQHELYAKYVYSGFGLTGQIKAASKKGKGALKTALKTESKSMVKAISHHGQRQFWASGTGILGKVASYGGTSITLDTTYQTAAGAGGWPTNTRHFIKGMDVCWGTTGEINGAATQSGYATVDGITSNTVVLLTGVTGTNPATNDYICMGDNAYTSFNGEFMGLRGMANLGSNYVDPETGNANFDPDSLQSLNGSSDETQWNGEYIQLNSGTVGVNLAIDHIELAVDKFYNENAEYPDCMFMSSDVKREYTKLLRPDVRFAPQQLQGGQKSISFSSDGGDIPIKIDRFCWENEIVFMKKGEYWYSYMQPFGFISTGLNGGIMRQTTRKDNEEAFYGAYGNFGTSNRRCVLRLRDINATAA